MSRVLVIGDVHEPCCKKGYLQFCEDLYAAWDCDTTVFIGDLTDLHSISFHQTEPTAPGVKREYELTLAGVEKWHESFPNAIAIKGNHDARIVRKAKTVNIPDFMLKSYNDIWETPTWNWVDSTIIDDVYYMHGDGCGGGMYPATNNARKMAMSVVMGHFHKVAGCQWMGSPFQRWFGLDTGCGLDDKAYAFKYAEKIKQRSIIAAGVVIDGVGYSEPMKLEKYD